MICEMVFSEIEDAYITSSAWDHQDTCSVEKKVNIENQL